jgi:uncharacterized RDD family membrane protein YckC
MLQCLPIMFCPKCGQKNEDAARFCQTCGQELGLVAQPAPQVTVVRSVDGYAGFWKRAAAAIVDALIVGAISGIVTGITAGLGVVSIFFLPWIYEAYMLSSERQATFGKMMMEIAVTDMNGGRLTFARATGRHFAKWVSALILGIGFIMAAFTSKKQALHDLIAETLVVHKPA